MRRHVLCSLRDRDMGRAVKVGDLVKFRQLDPSWGEVGLITNLTVDGDFPGMITFMTPVLSHCTIPWSRRNTYIKEVINESR